MRRMPLNHIEKLKITIAAMHPLPDSATQNYNEHLVNTLKDMERKIEQLQQKVDLLMHSR